MGDMLGDAEVGLAEGSVVGTDDVGPLVGSNVVAVVVSVVV